MRRVVVVLVGSVRLAALTAGAASADVTVHVSTPADEHVMNGHCSLVEAIQYADGQLAPDCGTSAPSGIVTIDVPADCYQIFGGAYIALLANSPVTLVAVKGAGPGPATCHGGGTVIDAEQAAPAQSIVSPGSNVAVSGVTLTGGRPCNGVGGCDGGGVDNTGRLTLGDVLVTGNVAAPGDDQTTPGTGAPGGNGGNGGGVFNAAGARLTVTDSGIVGNAAGTGGAGADGLGNSGGSGGEGGAGGGIYNNGGSVSLRNSTVSGNMAGTGGTGGLGDSSANSGTSGGDGGPGGSGGGIVTVPGLSGTGTLDLTSVTVAGNSIGRGGSGGQGFPSGASGPGGLGGGIASTGTASLTNVTVAGNSGGLGGDGVLTAGGVVSEYGSLIAGNGDSGGQNCAGGIVNRGSNITYPAQSASDCPGVVADPKLGALGAHGGRVDTIALGPGSAAMDAEPLTGGACPGTDERGVPRAQRAACDAGAYESAPPGLTHVNATVTGSTTATVTADVDPHLRDATVVVRFGRSASYGSSSQAVAAGSAAGVVDVSVPVTGLAPGASYHLALVATNADGATSSADQTPERRRSGPRRRRPGTGADQRASVGATLAPRAGARDIGSASPVAGRNNVHLRAERRRHGHVVIHTDSARTPRQGPLRGAHQPPPRSPTVQPRPEGGEPRVARPRGRGPGPLLRTALTADPAEARQLHRGNRRGRPQRQAVRPEDAELHDRPSLGVATPSCKGSEEQWSCLMMPAATRASHRSERGARYPGSQSIQTRG